LNQLKQAWPRQVATGQSADRSAHSKELSLPLDQRFLKFAVLSTKNAARRESRFEGCARR
jgi:hypothetical protein